MAQIVKSQCPECGANLQFDADAVEAKCQYCQAVSRIERAKPPRSGESPLQAGPVVYAPKSISRAIIAFIVIFSVLPVLIGIIAALAAAMSAASSVAPNLAAITTQAAVENMQWVGHRRPMLADVNADGILDPIGWVRFLNGVKTTEHIAAFDAVTGYRLWLTPPLVDSSQSYNAKAAVAGDKVVVTDPLGALRAFSLANGQHVWSAALGERAERICGAGQGLVRVETTDKRLLNAALATGQISPAGAAQRETPCTGVQPADGNMGLYSSMLGGTWNEGGVVNPEIEGMEVRAVVTESATGQCVAIGEKRPGTRVPMAALYNPSGVTERNRKAAAQWMTVIPSVDPLSVAEGAPENAALSRGRLVVPFELQGRMAGWRLACLEAATGRKLWEVAVPKSDTGTMGPVVLSDRQIFLSHWIWLDIFDLDTGVHRTTIGMK